MRYQIAQKFHACSDPHDPPTTLNDRARDVVDLVLLAKLTQADGHPTLAAIRDATEAVVQARAADARQIGRTERTWRCHITAYAHWANDYTRAAESAGITTPLIDAVATINEWIQDIAAAKQSANSSPWGDRRRARPALREWQT